MTRRMVGQNPASNKGGCCRGGVYATLKDHSYHGFEHSYTPMCDSEPKCREVTKPEDRLDTTSPRASALNEARDLITGDRNNQYGPPTQDFRRTAELLNALGYRRVVEINDDDVQVAQILPSDVAIIIAQVKVSRIIHSRGKRDSWVDLAGYAACGYECAAEEEETDG